MLFHDESLMNLEGYKEHDAINNRVNDVVNALENEDFNDNTKRHPGNGRDPHAFVTHRHIGDRVDESIPDEKECYPIRLLE